jgi:hypothetical protein
MSANPTVAISELEWLELNHEADTAVVKSWLVLAN